MKTVRNVFESSMWRLQAKKPPQPLAGVALTTKYYVNYLIHNSVTIQKELGDLETARWTYSSLRTGEGLVAS